MTLKDAAKIARRQSTARVMGSPLNKQLGELCLDRVKKNTSDQTFTLRILANQPYNHPYGVGAVDYRGRPRGPVPHGSRAIINYQSGDLYRHWKLRITPTGFVLWNDSEHARFLRGAHDMLPRPVFVPIVEDVIKPFCRKNGIQFKTEIK